MIINEDTTNDSPNIDDTNPSLQIEVLQVKEPNRTTEKQDKV